MADTYQVELRGCMDNCISLYILCDSVCCSFHLLNLTHFFLPSCSTFLFKETSLPLVLHQGLFSGRSTKAFTLNCLQPSLCSCQSRLEELPQATLPLFLTPSVSIYKDLRHLTPTAAACLLVPVDLSEEPERTLLLSLFCCCTGNIFGVGISLTYIYLTFLSLSTILFFFILFLIIPLVKHFPT